MEAVTRALFVNAGILGQRTFASFVRTAFAAERDGVRAVQVLVTDGLTPSERVMRHLLCLPLWPAGALDLKNIDLHRFRCEWNAGLLARNRIRRLRRAGEHFDVLHFHRQATAYASLDLMHRIPSIVSCDTTQQYVANQAASRLEARSYGPNIRRDGKIFRAAKLIISVSEWAARSIREEYPDCTTEIAVMPNPVAVPPSSEVWLEERYRRAVGTPAYRPRFLFVGGDFPRKGGYDLLRVWKSGRFGDRASLDVVSGWPIDRAAVPAGVTVHQHISHHDAAWHAIWRAADIFVLPSRDEAFGIVYQEAGAAGLPAIGTRITAIPETIRHGETGLLVPAGADDALAAAMNALIESPDRRREMGARARRFMAASADPERYRHTLAAAIRRLAGR